MKTFRDILIGSVLTLILVVVILGCKSVVVKEAKAMVLPHHEAVPNIPRQEGADPEIKFGDKVLVKGCYVAASGYKDAYDAQMQLAGRKHWARLMYVDITTVEGHAICVFHYNGEWKVYDNMKGTIRLGTFDRDPTPEDIARRIAKNYGNASWLK